MRVRVIGVAIAMSACGTVLGFEDPIDMRNDGTSPAPDAPGDTCVPLAPADWQGPLIVFEGKGSPAPTPPLCPDGYRAEPAYAGTADPAPADVQCHCACGAATGGACEGIANFFKDKACDPTMTCGTKDTLVNAQDCAGWPAVCGSAKLSTRVTGGSCPGTPTSAPEPKKDVPYGSNVRLCAPLETKGGGCAADRIAVLTSADPFDAGNYCVVHAGDLACPATYPGKRVYYTDQKDDRACACACDPPAGSTCSGSFHVADAASAGACTGGPSAVELPQAPACGGDIHKAGKFTAGPITYGSCAPKSVPTGGVSRGTPTTICCTR